MYFARRQMASCDQTTTVKYMMCIQTDYREKFSGLDFTEFTVTFLGQVRVAYLYSFSASSIAWEEIKRFLSWFLSPCMSAIIIVKACFMGVVEAFGDYSLAKPPCVESKIG